MAGAGGWGGGGEVNEEGERRNKVGGTRQLESGTGQLEGRTRKQEGGGPVGLWGRLAQRGGERWTLALGLLLAQL